MKVFTFVALAIVSTLCSCRSAKVATSIQTSSQSVEVSAFADTTSTVLQVRDSVTEKVEIRESEEWWKIEFYPPSESDSVPSESAIKSIAWKGRKSASSSAASEASESSIVSESKTESMNTFTSSNISKTSEKRTSSRASRWWLLLILVVPVSYIVIRYMRYVRKSKI